MQFVKMQGAGNDYVYVDCFRETVADPGPLAVRLSNRHFGVGSDGLVLICPSDAADCRMRMFNADGSEGEMCGNAIRCVGKYVYEHGIAVKERLTVETLAGVKTLELTVIGGKVTAATVDMGVPELTSQLPEEIFVEGRKQTFVGISMGNPHAVYFRDEIGDLKLEAIGPEYENHPRFPDRVNSEFVQVVDRGHVRMRVWERGSGETMACGTGASACAAACMLMGYTDDTVQVKLCGGTLTIRWDRAQSGHLFMTGPAEEVFCGEIAI